ncbi:MAG: hypothetical protein RR313_09605 [Anaerovoracaceae bacterium]
MSNFSAEASLIAATAIRVSIGKMSVNTLPQMQEEISSKIREGETRLPG